MREQPAKPEETISGIEVMRGVGAKPAKGFWADAWDLVIRQWGARFAMVWIALVGFFAITAPFLANGMPVWTVEYELLADGARGEVVQAYSPLWNSLTSIDLILLLGAIVGIPWLALPISVIPLKRSHRLGILCAAAIQSGLTLVVVWVLSGYLRGEDVGEWIRSSEASIQWGMPFAVAFIFAVLCVWIPTFKKMIGRVVLVVLVLGVSALVAAERWNPPISNYDKFIEGEVSGKYENTFTLIPWSPNQSRTDLYLVAPMETVAEKFEIDNKKRIAKGEDSFVIEKLGGEYGRRRFLLGTDGVGQDVMSQMMHACRLSISHWDRFHRYFSLHRHRDRFVDGVFRGLGGSAALANTRGIHGDPSSVPADCGRGGSAEEYLCDDGNHRLRELDAFSAFHSRRIPEHAQAGFRTGRQSCRTTSSIGPFPAHASQWRDTGTCPGLLCNCSGDPCRSNTLIPRPGPDRPGFVGQVTFQCNGCDRHLHLVAGDLPWHGDLPDGARLQPPGRGIPECD